MFYRSNGSAHWSANIVSNLTYACTQYRSICSDLLYQESKFYGRRKCGVVDQILCLLLDHSRNKEPPYGFDENGKPQNIV